MKTGMRSAAKTWIRKLELQLSLSEQLLLSSLDSPPKIQAFLNSINYSEDNFYRCPLRLLRERKGHCFDGALFAAMALRRIGFPPLILELIPNERDDDHLLALFKQQGYWGAVAKSNFTGLRYREPIYRNLRELVMSYFEDFFNSIGEKTLRGYRNPIHLVTFDHLDWMSSDAGLQELADGMDRYLIHPILTDGMAAGLSLMDGRSLQAGLIGAKTAGLFKI
jgi:hypothetical protein